MARAGPPLDDGDRFPSIAFETLNHGRRRLPEAFAGSWGLLLVFRAHW